MLNTLGERISCYRKNCGLTQEQLAEKCSVSAQAVSKWENNITAPDISILPTLAEIFGVTCDDLLGVQRKEAIAVDPNSIDLNRALLKVRISTSVAAFSDDDDKSNGKTTVNVNLPLSAAEVVLSSGIIKNANLDGIDFKQIFALAKSGVIGKLVEINSDNGDIVEIWIE